MFRRDKLGMAVLLVIAAPIGAIAAVHVHSVKAHLHFLATSTSVHSELGTNQDIYLAEITLPRSDETILVRLIDEYPPYRLTLSSEILSSPDGAVLKVRRDKMCDRALTQMPLRTAPGDPLAILPQRLRYQPQLPGSIDPEMVLPCYRTVR